MGNVEAMLEGDRSSHARSVVTLSDRDRAVLEFESKWTRHEGMKEDRIRNAFGLSAARYYQLVNRILDDPAAVEAMPHDVHRLQRLRAARVATRSARRL